MAAALGSDPGLTGDPETQRVFEDDDRIEMAHHQELAAEQWRRWPGVAVEEADAVPERIPSDVLILTLEGVSGSRFPSWFPGTTWTFGMISTRPSKNSGTYFHSSSSTFATACFTSPRRMSCRG